MPTSGSAAVTLKKLSAAATGLTTTITLATTLKKLSVAAAAKDSITTSGAGAAILKRVAPTGFAWAPFAGVPPSIICVTGMVTSTSSAIFQFQGPPYRSVTWSTNAGEIIPFTDHTDKHGRAYARFLAGGFTGNLNVQVSYGS